MSKCAQNMLGKLLALDMKPKGIAICNLHPGFMKTTMTQIYADKYDELGAIGPEEAAPGIVKVPKIYMLLLCILKYVIIGNCASKQYRTSCIARCCSCCRNFTFRFHDFFFPYTVV